MYIYKHDKINAKIPQNGSKWATFNLLLKKFPVSPSIKPTTRYSVPGTHWDPQKTTLEPCPRPPTVAPPGLVKHSSLRSLHFTGEAARYTHGPAARQRLASLSRAKPNEIYFWIDEKKYL